MGPGGTPHTKNTHTPRVCTPLPHVCTIAIHGRTSSVIRTHVERSSTSMALLPADAVLDISPSPISEYDKYPSITILEFAPGFLGTRIQSSMKSFHQRAPDYSVSNQEWT